MSGTADEMVESVAEDVALGVSFRDRFADYARAYDAALE
jgi:hypothetical protein